MCIVHAVAIPKTKRHKIKTKKGEKEEKRDVECALHTPLCILLHFSFSQNVHTTAVECSVHF